MTDLTNSSAGKAIIGNATLTHGTLENRNLDKARAVYEEVIGLRCVRHSPRSQLVAGAGGVAIVCVETGSAAHEQGDENRWVVLAGSADAVGSIRDAASRSDAIGHLGAIADDGGAQHFVMQDADSNWWEITARSPDHYQKLFEAGDIAVAS